MQRVHLPIYAKKRPAPPRWGADNPYNNRVLQHNWYEERRQFHQDCPRCTGTSITKSDYPAHCAEEYAKVTCLPPKEYEIRREAEGEGFKLLMNTQDYCDYMSNYTTTYDLMYNWEVRRADVKPKPWRRWNMVTNALWVPQPDNALPFGNLTQYGYRQAPQLPLVPNDWQTYQKDTTYKVDYTRQRYPDSYTLTRYAAPKCVRREVDDMTLVRRPGLCDCCPYWMPKNPKDNDAAIFPCHCHQFIPNVPRFHPTLIPGHTIIPKPPIQTVFPNSKSVHDSLKRPPHPDPIPGEPILESVCPGPCYTNEFCNDVMTATATCDGGCD